jgi:hypothetical protein
MTHPLDRSLIVELRILDDGLWREPEAIELCELFHSRDDDDLAEFRVLLEGQEIKIPITDEPWDEDDDDTPPAVYVMMRRAQPIREPFSVWAFLKGLFR